MNSALRFAHHITITIKTFAVSGAALPTYLYLLYMGMALLTVSCCSITLGVSAWTAWAWKGGWIGIRVSPRVCGIIVDDKPLKALASCCLLACGRGAGLWHVGRPVISCSLYRLTLFPRHASQIDGPGASLLM